MRKQGLQSITVKKYKTTTNPKHSYLIYDNVLERQFKVEKLNNIWVANHPMTKE